jgi:hypothetical protein
VTAAGGLGVTEGGSTVVVMVIVLREIEEAVGRAVWTEGAEEGETVWDDDEEVVSGADKSENEAVAAVDAGVTALELFAEPNQLSS